MQPISLVQEVASRYRNLGAEVIVDPSAVQLPAEVQELGYRPSLLVTFPDRRLIVEVTPRGTLGQKPVLREVARALASVSGWDFEIVFADDWRAERSIDASWKPDTIRRHLADAERLFEDMQGPESVVLIVWALWEAAARCALSAEGTSIRGPESQTLINQLFEQGLLDREERAFLVATLASRNGLAHGFETQQTSRDDVAQLLALVKRLLNEASSSVAA